MRCARFSLATFASGQNRATSEEKFMHQVPQVHEGQRHACKSVVSCGAALSVSACRPKDVPGSRAGQLLRMPSHNLVRTSQGGNQALQTDGSMLLVQKHGSTHLSSTNGSCTWAVPTLMLIHDCHIKLSNA